MRIAAGLSLLVALAAPAVAAEDAYLKCSENARDNAGMNDCGDALLKRADAALNAAWKSALAAMPSEASKKALLDEQRAWNAYKEKSCAIYATGDFGREGQVMNYPTCRADVIEARTTYLRRLKDE